MLSARLRPIALTRMRTSPAAGCGSETSLNSRTSGAAKDANSTIRAMGGSYWFGTRHRKGAVRRALEQRSDDQRLEHRVAVGRGLRDRLDHIPVLEDLAVFQSEDVHHRFSAGIIGEAVPLAVAD